MIQQLICVLILSTAQTSICMNPNRVELTVPDDGQAWYTINEVKDVDPFANDVDSFTKKAVAIRANFNLRTWPPHPHTIADYDTFYGRIKKKQATGLDPESQEYVLVLFRQEGRYDDLQNIHLDQSFFSNSKHRLLLRLLTLSEMQDIFNAYTRPSDFSLRDRYCLLENLTRKEKRKYVLDHSGIPTLLGIQQRRKSPLNVIHKDIFHIVIRQLMALETARIGREPLQLEQRKQKTPMVPQKKEESRCGIQ